MKAFAPLAMIVCLFCISCQSGNNPVSKKEPVGDTANFYPVAGFFKKQIEYVDLHGYSIYLVRTIDGKKDSAGLSKEAFIAMSNDILKKVFPEKDAKAFYREAVFEDLSTDSYTLSYTTTDPARDVQSIDVLLTPETRIVKRVFMKSQYKRGDTTIDEQLSWKADKSFQLNRSKQTPGGYHSTELNYINWNDR
jgi:hypothetical protein